MKKLMFALATVAIAAVSQAAVTNWSVNAGTYGILYDGYNNNGTGTYTPTVMTGQKMYLLCVSSDTPGVGISQANLVKAFQSATTEKPFKLSDYAIPTTAGTSYGDTDSLGKPAITFTNGASDKGDFHTETGVKYSFYLAALTEDGKNLYVTDSANPVAAKASNQTQNISMSTPMKNSAQVFKGDAEWSSGGWYTASDVPEPTSGLLLLLGVAGLALKRKRA